jgi:hypothetical protein
MTGVAYGHDDCQKMRLEFVGSNPVQRAPFTDQIAEPTASENADTSDLRIQSSWLASNAAPRRCRYFLGKVQTGEIHFS